MSDVSVVIPTYNGARFIREALESVFAQTLPPQEIIVVDDASTDGTPNFVEQIAGDAPVPLRLIRLKENSGGPAHPMNVGIASAGNNLIVLSDQDDVLMPTKAETVHQAFTRTDAAIVFGRHSRIDDRGGAIPGPPDRIYESYRQPPAVGDLYTISGGTGFELLLRDGYCYGGASGTALQRGTWSRLGKFSDSLRIAWDLEYALRVTGAGFPVAFADQDFCAHRLHERNLESRDNGWCVRREIAAALLTASVHPMVGMKQRRQLRVAAKKAFLALAYDLRESSQYLHACRAYLDAALRFRTVGASTVGIAKVLGVMAIRGRGAATR